MLSFPSLPASLLCPSLCQPGTGRGAFFLPLQVLRAASVVGRTSQPCGVLGCQQSGSIPPCQDAFSAKIHLKALVLPLLLHFWSICRAHIVFLKIGSEKKVLLRFFFDKYIFVTWGERFIY